MKKGLDIHNVYAYVLSTLGWYISSEMLEKDVFQIFLSIKNGDIEAIEKMLLQYYNETLDQKMNDLLNKYPEKENIISETFKAHNNEMYFASTILFLSLTDGICKGRLFKSKKFIQEYLKTTNSPNIAEAVLGKQSAIDSDTRNSDQTNYFSDLNRHGIMHGLHWEYGTKKNSLKALSLLCFTSDFVNRNSRIQK
ncbi:MAG: hypothetical protein V1775_01850 [Bacteroidota bacterium]